MPASRGEDADDTRIQQEAAAWFARLNTQRVDAATLEAFRVWRKAPGRRAAYAQVESVYSRSGELKLDPQIEALLQAALERHPLPAGPKRPALRVMIAGSALVVGLVVLGLVSVGLPRFLPHSEREAYVTAVGEQRSLRLPDGSRMWLDTDTQVRVRMTPASRDIILLQGQAMFEVAHDGERPFRVGAGETSITALGTRFDVRRNDARVVVTLLEGEVEVRRGAAEARLRPGEQITSTRSLGSPTSVNLEIASSWTQGRLIFDATPLAEAVEEVNRYSTRKLSIQTQEATNDRISGAFDAGDIEAFAQAVAQLHDLQIQSGPEGLTLAATAPKRSSP